MPKFTLEIQGTKREFEASRQGNVLHLNSAGESHQVQVMHISESTYELLVETAAGRQVQMRLAGIRDGDRRQIWFNGRHLSYQRLRERGHGPQGDTSLAAAIPAVVTEVLVQVGDVVAEGQKLILLESMKMVIPIQAPYAGSVTAVSCQAGDSVPAGFQLLTLQESEE